MTTLLLIDDHFVVRSGLVASLELEDDLKVVGEADRGEDASRLFAQTKPDVVLMDIQLPGLSGIDATAALLREHPTDIEKCLQDRLSEPEITPREREILTLRITDNGHGFDPTAETTGKPGHFGCIGIRERARKVGAEVKWESEPSKGTQVTITRAFTEPLSPTRAGISLRQQS